jgi:hypothetical protein
LTIVEFLEPTQAELTEAIAYYNSRQEGLGDRFAEEVRRSIDRILQFPEAWSPISKRTRPCRTKGFPFGIIYQVRGDVLLIVAVMHLHRRPLTWKRRLREIKD